MEYIVNNSQVYTKRVTDGGTVIVTYHDAEYHFRLTSDGGTVTAQIYDYLGEQQDTDGVEVTFDIDGKQQVAETEGGAVSIAVPSDAKVISVSAPGYRVDMITVAGDD